MKAIKIIDIEVSSSQPPVAVPSEAERAMAAMTNAAGTQLITFWMKGQQNMFNEDLSKLRNCATLETYDFSVFGSAAVHTFADINGVEVSEIAYKWANNVSRPTAGDWTLVFAGQPKNTGVEGTNYGVFGNNTNDNKGFVNPPNLNITQAGNIRVASSSANSTWLIQYNTLGAALFTQPRLIVVTQSAGKGITLRVDGTEVATNTGANAVLASTGTDHNFLQSGAASAVFQGKLGEILLLSDDVSKTPDRLATIEAGLKAKYGIA